MNKYIILLGLFLSSFVLSAQETTVYTEAQEAYKQGKDFFEKGVYSAALQKYERTLQLLLPVQTPEYDMICMDAELGRAQSAVRMDLPDGEKLMLDFIRKYQPDPVANAALIEVANYLYNAKKYDKALEYFSKIPTYQMTKAQKAEVRFKMGYAQFSQKKFSQAKSNFKLIKDETESEYYYPTNYYLGLCEFFAGNYDSAVKSFRLVERNRKYAGQVPYYIAQIYFAEKQYDALIDYVEPKINDRGVKKQKELQQLLGQTYFERGDYARALPYLEFYAQRASKLPAEGFYQLAYSQFKAGKYKAAAKNFEQLSSESNALGQNALYHLGICQLKASDRVSAHSAFAKASRMNYDRNIQEDALFNYAKLSYELKRPREAIKALESISTGSKYYSESQELMGQVLLNTRDYAKAIEIIDGMPNQTPTLREAYQKAAFYRGMQLYRDGKNAEARPYFRRAIDNPIDAKTKALALYWMGDMAHNERKYDESKNYMSQFLTLAKTVQDLPDEASVYTANYTQGYNYLKQKNYNAALGYFQDAAAGISRNKSFINNRRVSEDILGDATLRAGDGYFKKNKYDDALRYYNTAVQNRYNGFEYALYQKAIIEGLAGRKDGKLLALENLANNYPRSEFADDALFQMALTYQEVGQNNQAVNTLKRLVKDHPSSTLINQAYLKMGLITYNQGNPRGAIDYYKRVFANNPQSTEASDALAALKEIYIDDLGDPNAYFDFLNTIPGYNVEDVDKDNLSFQSAESKFENGEYARAVSAYTTYLRSYPNGLHTLVALFHRAESYAVQSQFGEAFRDYEAVVNKGPSPYYEKSLKKAAIIAYNHSQDFGKAYTLYTKWEQVAGSATDQFEAQLGALRAAYRSNNAQGVAIYSRKVADNSNASAEERAFANFYIAKAEYDKKNYDGAANAFKQVIAANFDNEETAEARYLLAQIYYQQRRLDEAEDAANRAIQENSAYPFWVAKSMILLADTLAEKGDFFNARAVLEALIENYDGDAEVVSEAKRKLEQYKRQSEGMNRIQRAGEGGFMDESEEGN